MAGRAPNYDWMGNKTFYIDPECKIYPTEKKDWKVIKKEISVKHGKKNKEDMKAHNKTFDFSDPNLIPTINRYVDPYLSTTASQVYSALRKTTRSVSKRTKSNMSYIY